MSRPVVSVFNGENVVSTTTLPAVFTAPIRSDIVQYVHTLMAKNKRQAYAVSEKAGMQSPAESWGTGRAVSRIPRVPGGGTARSGQGAFGNMCRGGRMFGPTKIWRKWHKKISVNQRRYAVSAALAATALPSLVMARGHKISKVPEFPLVVADAAIEVDATKKAVALLKTLGADEDVQKSKDSKKIRVGAGKSRNRRYTQRKGPLVVYDASANIDKAFRNISGVDVAQVDSLSLLDLAPGGHLGRFIVWTQSAFDKLDSLFGTYDEAAKLKSGFNLPRSFMTNADLARLINSDEIQSVVKPAVTSVSELPKKVNPLKNKTARLALNPYYATVVKREQEKVASAKQNRAKKLAEKRETSKKFAQQGKAFYEAASAEGSISF